MRFFSFISGFFKDQNEQPSSKRLAVYFSFFLLYKIVIASLEGKSVNTDVLYVVAGVILFGIGAVTSEFFSKLKDNSGDSKKTPTP